MLSHLPDVNVCKTQKQMAISNPVYRTPPWKTHTIIYNKLTSYYTAIYVYLTFVYKVM
jgi:hypothetical protein